MLHKFVTILLCLFLFVSFFVFSFYPRAGVGTVDLSNNRFDPSLLDGIKHRVKLDLTGCRA